MEKLGRLEALAEIRARKIIVAVRGVTPEVIAPTVRALCDGGISMIEITFDQKDPETISKTSAAISAARAATGSRAFIGAGTVMSAANAQAAVDAGAQFLLAPNLDEEVMSAANALNVAMIPGAMSPSEIATAWKLGAAFVKIFPAAQLGLAFCKAVAAPMGHIPLMPMGGVSAENIRDFIACPNVAGVGIGAAIAKNELIAAGNFAALTELAKSFTNRVSS